MDSISLAQRSTSVKVLSQMQESALTIEISSPVEDMVVEQRTAAEDTTRPRLPSRLITCSQTMLGDRELSPPIVRLQDLEHDSKGVTSYLKTAKSSRPLASQPRLRLRCWSKMLVIVLGLRCWSEI